MPRDDLPGLAREESVAFGVVGLVLDEGCEEPGQVGGIHLGVAGHDGHQGALRRTLQGDPVPADDGRAHAAVAAVPDDLEPIPHARNRRLQDFGRAVPGRVVHHHDAVDEGGHRVQNLSDQLLLVVGRHDHDDPPVFEHERVFYLMRSRLQSEAGAFRPGRIS